MTDKPAINTTSIDDVTFSSSRMITALKVATASEPASYAFSLGTSRNASAGVMDLRGVNTTVPVEALADATGASGNAVAPAVTTATTNTLIVTAVGVARNTTVTPAAGTTERFDQASPATDTEVATAAQATAGTVAARTATPASTLSGWAAQTIALRDAANATLTVAGGTPTSFSGDIDAGDTSGSYSMPFTVTDTRTGATASLGWNLTITSTSFVNGASKRLDPDISTITGATLSCANGGICDAPTNGTTYPIALPAGTVAPTAVKFFSAPAGKGEGLYSLTVPVDVALRQNAYTGSFSSTITVSVVSGP